MSILKAIRLILTIRCEQSSRLASESLDRNLTRAERWAMKFHEFICKSCRRCRRQLMELRDAARLRNKGAGDADTVSLSEDQRARILESLRQANRDG